MNENFSLLSTIIPRLVLDRGILHDQIDKNIRHDKRKLYVIRHHPIKVGVESLMEV